MTFTYITGDWHFWEAPGLISQCIASYEPTKRLHSFSNWDDCINSLYLQGEKDVARALNEALKRYTKSARMIEAYGEGE